MSPRTRSASLAALFRGVMAVGLTAPVIAAATSQDWQIAGNLGMMQFVIVPEGRARDRAYYDTVIQALCPSDQTCFLRFYTNSTQAKAEVPLPDAIIREPAAMFQRSAKQGNAVFQWACRMGVAAGNCF